ncbi:ABC transporter permease [Nocardioides mangrovicus]|uniref:ABC transporter permease n=1 Tax=Nocardioides mangrovicus TaxID=2478913 RepID=A0A3L8P6K1_9ACTN|nr:ABC transporter permease [Nocardioides mangrovicus]RLV50333.1 ABC transporter permease [Nocardioides mangrovicus]
MIGYLVRRVGTSLLVLLGLVLATFLIVRLVPGDPVQALLGARATPQAVAQARQALGLEEPVLQQLWSYFVHLLTGDLGTSIPLQEPVSSAIGSRLAPSVLLIVYGLVVALVVGVPLAVVAALRPRGVVDHLVRFTTTFAFAMPTFWLGLMLALLFGLRLGWFPVSGYESGFGGVLRSLTLPAITLGLSLAVVVVRTLRTSLIDVMRTEYVEAARSRGMSTTRVVVRHALRNAVMPTITLLSVDIGFLIGGTVVIESVFRLPGLGTLLLSSVQRRDYPLIQAITLLAGAAVVVVGLCADLLQAVLDPRVRLGRS